MHQHWFLDSKIKLYFKRLNIIFGVWETVKQQNYRVMMLTLHFSFNCFVMQATLLILEIILQDDLHFWSNKLSSTVQKGTYHLFCWKLKKDKNYLTKSGCMSVRNVNILPWFPNSRSRVTTCLLRRMYSRIIFLGNATHKVRTKIHIFLLTLKMYGGNFSIDFFLKYCLEKKLWNCSFYSWKFKNKLVFQNTIPDVWYRKNWCFDCTQNNSKYTLLEPWWSFKRNRKTLRQGRPPRESEEGDVRCGRRAMRGDQQRHFWDPSIDDDSLQLQLGSLLPWKFPNLDYYSPWDSVNPEFFPLWWDFYDTFFY